MSDAHAGRIDRTPAPHPAFADLAEMAAEGVYLVDAQRRILTWNPAAQRITGWTADAVVGRRCFDGILRHVDGSGRLLCRSLCPLAAAMRDGRERSATVWLHHFDGHRVEVTVHCRPVVDESGRVTGAIETFTGRQEPDAAGLLAEARQQAILDPLTGLANRRLGETRLRQRIEDLGRHGLAFSVAMADLDEFKALNDTYGHLVGDRALRMTADTLRHSVRGADLTCRWGGEEFLMVLDGARREDARMVAERFRSLLAASQILVDGAPVRLTASVGVAQARPGDDPDALIARADERLYAAKAAGRDRVAAGVR